MDRRLNMNPAPRTQNPTLPMTNASPPAKSRSPSSASAGQSGRPSGESSSAAGSRHHFPSPAAIRETIESVAIAFVLGFLVPHVRGRGVCDSHRLDGADLDGAPQGRDLSEVRVSLSGQRQRGGERGRRAERRRQRYARFVSDGTCPMCRYTAPLKKTIPTTATGFS